MSLHLDTVMTQKTTAVQAAAWAAFEAPTAAGSARLWVLDHVRHAADAAIALEASAPLLDALDAWFGFSPAWRWCAPGSGLGPSQPHARAQWHGADGAQRPGCRIELPWPLLRSLPAPPESLAQQLRWTAVPATLVLGQFPISEEDLQCLEPGGAVLLPGSMARPWLGWMRAADEKAVPGAGLPVVLASPFAPQPLGSATAGGPAPVAADDELFEVRLAMPLPLEAPHLAGWSSATPDATGARASLWRCAGDGGGARKLGVGSLLPWGDGWALHVETLE